MKKVGVSLPEAYVKGLEQLVKNGFYTSRAEAIRIAVKELVAEEVGFHQSPLAWMKHIRWVDRDEYTKKTEKT